MNTDLQKLADDIEDIADPTAIDKVLSYTQQIHEEDEEFMELLFERCKGEFICWEQPWYQQSTCLTRRLQETREEETAQYRTDSISLKEDRRIKKNWKNFIMKYDLPDKLISYARWRNSGCRNPNSSREKVRRYVAAYLAKGLHRTVYQVHRYVMTHTVNQHKKQYTPAEKKIMEVCFHHKPEKAVTYLSTILCREPRGIYKRMIHTVNGKPPRKRLKWTLDLASKFLNSLIKHTGMPLDELKNKKFDTSIWLKVQDDMDHSYEYLQKFWYKNLHAQLFVKHDVKLNKLRKKIYKLLREYPFKVWTDIRWDKLLDHFSDGYTRMFLYKTCSTVIRSYPDYLEVPLEHLIEYGLEMARKARNNERRLKTLKLNDEGQLEKAQYKKE